MNAQSVPNSSEICRLLLEAQAVRFGEFTLASGQTSDVYVDVKRAWTDPHRLATIARAFAEHVGSAERLAGMELGAVPLVVATSLLVGRPIVVIRKAAKEHGTKQRYEGEIPPNSEVLLIEDVATTGGSAAESIAIVRAAGGRVDRALVVVDREMGASERLATLGVELTALATLKELRGARA
ncbi:MAG: orotate phosphoribosyltransferase [Thermoplasmata archaeon]